MSLCSGVMFTFGLILYNNCNFCGAHDHINFTVIFMCIKRYLSLILFSLSDIVFVVVVVIITAFCNVEGAGTTPFE